LFFDEQKQALRVIDEAPNAEELKVLHTAIKKVQEDLDRYSFNTVVSSLMICVNELGQLKCHKRAVLKDLILLLSPYAPHLCEELWEAIGEQAGSLSFASFPSFNPAHLQVASQQYPISFNGKVRLNLSLPSDAGAAAVEAMVLADAQVQKFLEGQAPKKSDCGTWKDCEYRLVIRPIERC